MVPAPIDLERHKDSEEEDLDVHTLAYTMVRPYIVVVVVVDWDIEAYVDSSGDVNVHCTRIEALAVVDNYKNHMDFDNSHERLPFPWVQFRNHRYVPRVE